MALKAFFKTHCACAVSLCFFLASFYASGSDVHPVGEKLTYKAYAVGILPIGTVTQETFTSNFEGRTTYCFTGRCYGNYLVYLADVRLAAQVARYSGESLFHDLEQYGTDRTLRALNSVNQAPMETVLPAVRRDIAEFVDGADQFDDITMLGFEFKGFMK